MLCYKRLHINCHKDDVSTNYSEYAWEVCGIFARVTDWVEWVEYVNGLVFFEL